MRLGGDFYFRTIQNLGYGIITNVARGKAPIGSLLESRNVRVATGSIKKRDGQDYLKSIDQNMVSEDCHLVDGIVSLYEYSRQYTVALDGSIGIYNTFIFTAGGHIYLWEEGDTTAWNITDDLSIPSLSSDDIYCCTYLDSMYITNGIDTPIKTNATNNPVETCVVPDSGKSYSMGNASKKGMNKLTFYRDRLYGINEQEDPSIVYYTELGQPENFGYTSGTPPIDYDNNWLDIKRDDGDIVTIMGVSGGTFYIFKNRSIWSLAGDPEANALLQVEIGGDTTPNQSEYGLGCTSPRSLVSVGDSLIFYSKIHGVYKLSGNGVECISRNIAKDITNIENAKGGVYVDGDGIIYYILTTNMDGAWICNLADNTWLYDDNVNPSSNFMVDIQGRLLGAKNGYINHYYKEGELYDNEQLIDSYIRLQWINFQDGHLLGKPRKLNMSAKDMSGFYTMQMWNENDQQPYFSATLDSGTKETGLRGDLSRLCSLSFLWRSGEIESLVLRYTKKPMR